LSRYCWFDDVEISILKRREENPLELLGVATYGDTGTSEEWVEPFGASLHLSQGSEDFVDYTLRFGRKGFEALRLPYEDIGRLVKQLMGGVRREWAHVFTRQDARGRHRVSASPNLPTSPRDPARWMRPAVRDRNERRSVFLNSEFRF
jgi:hypothetical protein